MQWEIDFLLWLQEVIPFKSFFAFITHLGDAGIFFVLIGLYLWFIKKDKKQAFHLFVAIALMAIIVNVTIKPLVMRIRPFDIYPMDLLVKAPHDYSFPSGHTAVSFASCYVLAKFNPKYKNGIYFLASLIAFSRLVLFVHYPTDVLAGAVIGVICGFISIRYFRDVFSSNSVNI